MTTKDALLEAIARCDGIIADASIEASEEERALAGATSVSEAIEAANAILAARQRIWHHEDIMAELRSALADVEANRARF